MREARKVGQSPTFRPSQQDIAHMFLRGYIWANGEWIDYRKKFEKQKKRGCKNE